MNYRSAVKQVWRHAHPQQLRTDARELVRYAALAASSHNTQPWRFDLAPNRIDLLPDYARRCPAVDPDDHHLFASLGCATENLVIAGRAAGFESHVVFDADKRIVRVAFEGSAPQSSPLFESIPVRQCTRTEYDGRSLTPDELRLLENAGAGRGVDVMLLTSAQQKGEVAEYVAAANSVQFADAAWATELQDWIRFSARDAIRTGDGLYGPVMGSPDVPPWIGKLFMHLAFSASAQNQKDSRNIKSSSAIAIIHSGRNGAEHWIEAGRCYERLALQATALNLRTAFINQPVEVAHMRPQFAQYLGLGERRPDLVVRIGHAPLATKSLRRPLSEVINAQAEKSKIGAPGEIRTPDHLVRSWSRCSNVQWIGRL